MKKTGQLLKDKREAAKLTISEVALATKINPKILTAMEEGNESALPSKTFLKGFLKAYAVFLKIDQDEVLRSYQEESGPPPPERVHEINKPVPAPPAGAAPKIERRRMGEENSASLRTAAVVVIVLLIGVIIGVRELIEKYQREKMVENSAIKVSPLDQPALVPEVKPVDPSVPVPPPSSALATPPGPAALPDVPPAKPADGVSSPSVPPVPPVPKAEVAKPALPDTPPVKEEHKLPPPKDEVPPASDTVNTEPAAPKKTSKNEIILEALDKVDVKFQIKGETKRVSLGPTQVHTIYSDQPVVLDLSDGGAVNVILNGRERGVPGDLGKPKQIKIP